MVGLSLTQPTASEEKNVRKNKNLKLVLVIRPVVGEDDDDETRFSRFSYVQKPLRSVRMDTTVSPWPEVMRSLRLIVNGSGH